MSKKKLACSTSAWPKHRQHSLCRIEHAAVHDSFVLAQCALINSNSAVGYSYGCGLACETLLAAPVLSAPGSAGRRMQGASGAPQLSAAFAELLVLRHLPRAAAPGIHTQHYVQLTTFKPGARCICILAYVCSEHLPCHHWALLGTGYDRSASQVTSRRFSNVLDHF